MPEAASRKNSFVFHESLLRDVDQRLQVRVVAVEFDQAVPDFARFDHLVFTEQYIRLVQPRLGLRRVDGDQQVSASLSSADFDSKIAI